MEKIVRKQYVKSFYMITFIFSFFLLILHFIFPSVGIYSVSFTQLSPVLAVIVISLVIKNKAIINDIKNQFHVGGIF